MEYTTKEMSYDASSGEGRIFARGFAPADKNAVRGILQIAHGMAEHSLRYESFAKYLVAKGFVVCVNDHAGMENRRWMRRALVIWSGRLSESGKGYE